MRKIVSVIVAAPLALALAACGETTPAEQATPEPVAADVPVNLPTIPVNSLTTIEYAGTYSKDMGDGTTSHITLNSQDDTYQYDAGDGKVISGKYKRMDDGSRIELADFGGKPAIFAVGTGAIYRMDSADTPLTDVKEVNMYSRDPDAAQALKADTAETKDSAEK
ncbi:hypothetical protein GRI39_09665 [Altererythrobacter indicus]|uniref:Copper resistance protein NlpE n=1 Tax=Altericroceibacterium indicum TaxID=374177 RepID=A0A845A7F5_9SPHN|nr:hypothetical protein [Altericroceibacterium indicum]MXP26302.1 hypothetical protein [Altericroceibacterium indicum]